MCYKIDSSTGCSDGTLTSSNDFGAELKCTKCAQPNAVISDTITLKTVCMPFDKIENCLFYDKNSTLASSSFFCSLCNPDFWLVDSKICVQWTYLSIFC